MGNRLDVLGHPPRLADNLPHALGNRDGLFDDYFQVLSNRLNLGLGLLKSFDHLPRALHGLYGEIVHLHHEPDGDGKHREGESEAAQDDECVEKLVGTMPINVVEQRSANSEKPSNNKHQDDELLHRLHGPGQGGFDHISVLLTDDAANHKDGRKRHKDDSKRDVKDTRPGLRRRRSCSVGKPLLVGVPNLAMNVAELMEGGSAHTLDFVNNLVALSIDLGLDLPELLGEGLLLSAQDPSHGLLNLVDDQRAIVKRNTVSYQDVVHSLLEVFKFDDNVRHIRSPYSKRALATISL